MSFLREDFNHILCRQQIFFRGNKVTFIWNCFWRMETERNRIGREVFFLALVVEYLLRMDIARFCEKWNVLHILNIYRWNQQWTVIRKKLFFIERSTLIWWSCSAFKKRVPIFFCSELLLSCCSVCFVVQPKSLNVAQTATTTATKKKWAWRDCN